MFSCICINQNRGSLSPQPLDSQSAQYGSFSPGLIVQLWPFPQSLPLYPWHNLVLCQGDCFLCRFLLYLWPRKKKGGGISFSSYSMLLKIIILELSAVILFPMNWESFLSGLLTECGDRGTSWNDWSLWEDFVLLNRTEKDRQALGGRYVTSLGICIGLRCWSCELEVEI